MRKSLLTVALCCMALQAFADWKPLAGFAYGNDTQPTGKEWESPEALSYNKEQPHAYFFSFDNVENARKVLPENSPYWKSLDGTWKFNWVATPEERPTAFYEPAFDVSAWDNIEVPSCWNIVGVQKDGTLKYGVPIYVNQPVIFMHSVKVDDWRGGVMRTPPKHWTTYKYRNEVGSYRRTFTVPADWKGRAVYINFDGVDSFFYLWINGHYVGFSKNSRNTASFNISDYLVKGENTVAVEVYRNSDASFLEAQDMFRLPGIIRSTYLTSTPTVQVRDLVVRTTLPDDLSFGNAEGTVTVDADIRNLSGKEAKGYTLTYRVFPNKLYSDESLAEAGEPVSSEAITVTKNGNATSQTRFTIKNARLWSAEQPYRYTLVAELKNAKGKTVDVLSTYFGVRQVEIKDTEAKDDEFGLKGRYFYVNKMPVKLKGVNRHETNPSRGHAITRQQMEKEVMLMKQGNINHVRNSHYSCDPYWYYLCDKYGIYLEDESNIESHQYYYGEASLSHPVEWKNAHVARNMELVHAHVNHPSIVIWSLGNEAGPGQNFVAAYNAIKEFDTSRPVQYERNNNIVDMGSNQYPSISWVRHAVKGNAGVKYPYHISEYAHSMGNAVGNLIDYWDAIESTNFFCGGAIWDWVDQAMDNYTKDGKHYMAYGGDFGDTPNDGMFCMNGIMLPDLSPKPQYFEVKKVYQNIGVKAVDMTKGEIEVFNKDYFTPLTGYEMVWKLFKDGKQVQESNAFRGTRNIQGPREKQLYGIPYDYASLDPKSEYFVTVQFRLAKDMPWAKKGYVQMEEQLPVKAADAYPTLAETVKGDAPKLTETEAMNIITGAGFTVKFDNATGTIYSLNYGGKTIIADGNGPVIDALRAPTDNDNWAYGQWFANGLHNLKHKATNRTVYTRQDGCVILSYTVESQAPCAGQIQGGSSGRYTIKEGRTFGPDDFKFTTNQIWTVYADGSIELESNISSNKPSLILPRLGYALKTPKDLNRYTYYGRGPVNNYNDRKTGSFVQLYTSSVKDQFVNFPKPQSMGNREDVRWCALTDNAGQGAQFITTDRMSTSALPWSALQLTLAPHPHELPASDGTYLHLDTKVTGLGGNSCGQGGPLSQDRVKADAHLMGLIIRPATADLTATAKVAPSGEMPLAITRDKTGLVTLISARKGIEVCYQVVETGKTAPRKGKKAPVPVYSEPFNLRNGGTVTAWYKDNPMLKTTVSFERIENIPVEVIFASSEETNGDRATNLVDGNPETFWHTMYSVTVAKYPHWVDFDCGELKNIKGFTYLPRQSGSNGNIKDYKIQVSLDNQTWTDVTEGRFENGASLKKVTFSKPVKGRYLRFTALSSQDGQDFASGAEFTVLAE